jgi:hypothetical protein
MLAGAPAVAAAALAGGTVTNALAIAEANAAGPDPVFAAIKREREAYAAYCATNEVQRRISDQDPCPPLITDGMPDLLHHEKRIVHPLHKAWWAEYQRAEDAHGESAQDLWSARVAFLKTQPTTVAELRAFVDHIQGPLSTGEAGKAFWDDNERKMAFPTINAAVRDLVLDGGAQS